LNYINRWTPTVLTTVSPNLAYMGPSCGRLLTKSEITIPPRQLQLAGTASSRVGIGWDPSVVFNDNRPLRSCKKDCDRGSTIGIGAGSLGRSIVGSTIGGPPIFGDPPNCCWFELATAEELSGSAWFTGFEVVDVVASAGLPRRRFVLELPASSESSSDACNDRLVLRGWDLTEYADVDKLYATSFPSQS